MKNSARFLLGLLAIFVVIAIWTWNSRSGQDWLLETAVTTAMSRSSVTESYDGLRVFLCGTSSPLPDPSRAQACVAVLAGDSLYIVDTGAGSARVAALGRLPLERLRAVFLTHYHSDHIAALPEFNLNSWVAGRTQPLMVIGPEGVSRVIEGMNDAYRLDLDYRVGHHGEELLPADIGPMQTSLMQAGSVQNFGDLKVTSFAVDHEPVRPAVGYRFDYRGRSLVISGDTVITPGLVEAAKGADLLLQDALSLMIVQTFARASAGTRMEKIFLDIQDYHAHTTDLPDLVEQSGVKQLALYHLVPPPQNKLFLRIFSRDLPEGTVITSDGMIFELPANSREISRIDP